MVTQNNPTTSATLQAWIPRKDLFKGTKEYEGLLANWLAIQRHSHPAPAVGTLRFATKVVAASNSVDTTSTHYDYLCTGTNDHTTINNALTAAAPGRVLLMEGQYNLNGQVVVPSNTDLCGMGRSTVLRFINGYAGGSAAGIALNNGTSGQRIASLTIDGNKANNAGQSINGINIQANSVTMEDLLVRNCVIAGITNGSLVNANNIVLANSYLDNNGTNGVSGSGNLYINAGSYWTVSNLIMTNAGVDDFVIGVGADATYWTINNCLSISPARDSFGIDGTNDLVLTGCSSYNAGRWAYNAAGSLGYDFSFIGCMARGSQQNAFEISSNGGPTDSSIIACTINHCGLATTNTYAGIHLNSGALRWNIQQCKINNPAGGNGLKYGILLDAGANTNIVVNNDLLNSALTASLQDNGTGNLKNLDGSANNWNRL